MSNLQVFANSEFGEIRTVEIGGEPWLVGKDVAVALGYEKPTDAVRKHVDREDRGISKIETPSGTQDMTIINESGLYSLILSSKLPGAKRFKRWITSEVLPAIRRTGAYAPQDAATQALERVAGCMGTMMEQFAALSQRVDMLEKRPDASSSFLPPVASRFTEIPTAANGFMNSMEVAHILGREHNNVLKGIRSVVGRARSEGFPVDEHFVLCHRAHWNKLRCPYYRLDETAVSMFSQNLKDWMLAEKLRAAFKAQFGGVEGTKVIIQEVGR